MFWIRDIVVRIRIRWSVPLTYPNPDLAHIDSCFQDANRTKVFFLVFFCLLRTVLFEVTFTLGFKDKDKKKSQHSRNQVFLFLIDDGRIKIRTNNDGSGSGRPKNLRIREAQKLTNPGGLKTYGSGSITLNKNSAFPEPVGWRPFSIGSIFKYCTVRTNSVPTVVSVSFYLNSSISFFIVYEHQYYVTP